MASFYTRIKCSHSLPHGTKTWLRQTKQDTAKVKQMAKEAKNGLNSLNIRSSNVYRIENCSKNHRKSDWIDENRYFVWEEWERRFVEILQEDHVQIISLIAISSDISCFWWTFFINCFWIDAHFYNQLPYCSLKEELVERKRNLIENECFLSLGCSLVPFTVEKREKKTKTKEKFIKIAENNEKALTLQKMMIKFWK